MIHDWSDAELFYLLEVICESLTEGGDCWPVQKRTVLIVLIEQVKHKLKARSQKPEARSQKPEARSQKPEARSQKPEARNKRRLFNSD